MFFLNDETMRLSSVSFNNEINKQAKKLKDFPIKNSSSPRILFEKDFRIKVEKRIQLSCLEMIMCRKCSFVIEEYLFFITKYFREPVEGCHMTYRVKWKQFFKSIFEYFVIDIQINLLILFRFTWEDI